MKPPAIKVEIIHIEGPLKGTIQEFFDPVIEIGRHPECHVCFPKDMNTISRKHVDIRREGNRFMAVDHSTNGTLVNGKSILEVILKDGDVLTISKNGPKISVLTTIIKEDELPPQLIQAQPSAPSPPEALPRSHYPEEPIRKSPPVEDLPPKPFPKKIEQQDLAPRTTVENTQTPFVIQLGAQIKSFQTLPIILGKGSGCDFVIEHSALLAEHAQIYYCDNSYHIKDLTGRGLVTINGKSLSDEASLVADTCVSLSDKGPTFQFLGEGRLAEIETSPHVDDTGNSLNGSEEKSKKKSFWPFTKK